MRPTIPSLLGAALLALAVVWTGCSERAAPEPQPMAYAQGGGPSEVIIHFRRQVSLKALQQASPQALINALQADASQAQAPALALLQAHGIQPRLKLWLANALVATVPQAVVTKLLALPQVESIQLDLLLQAPAKAPSGGPASPWNLSAIRVPELWAAGQRGAGVVVASLDTGVDLNHPDLSASWRSAAGWFDPFLERATPADPHGHGTQTMGLIVGGSASGTPVGVAPDARWIAARIYNDAGLTTLSAIHQALQWAIDPDGSPATDDAPDVVNNSWGFADLANQCFLEFEADIAALRAAGIAVVFAAGNSGPGSLTSVSPANNPSAFAVGAIDASQTLQTSSSRGPGACGGELFPELVAPGVSVRTTDLTSGGLFPDSYATVSGTSFAAPHVSGALALLLGAHPSASVAQLEQSLTETAADLGAAGPDSDYGHGVPDLVAAEAKLASLLAQPSCTDGDGDGYFAEATCGTPLDCNDADASVNPAACDIKGDGIDQDCDGADRTKGKACPTSDSGGTGDTGGTTTGSEGKGKTCGDGLDNDGDGQVDCSDPDCAGNKSCN